MTRFSGILFDKDGTLFDFYATWGAWSQSFLTDLARGNMAQAQLLGQAIGFDLDEGVFRKDSVVIAGTPGEIAESLLELMPDANPSGLIARMNIAAAQAPQVAAVPLTPLLTNLKARGLRLGVATNDAESPARSHLSAAGAEGFFDFIAGSDSGHGAKPQPGMLLAFADQLQLDPARCVMVGDSRHDLISGRAAGMTTVAVLTGLAEPSDLEPLADVVLPDIGQLPKWLDTVATAENAA